LSKNTGSGTGIFPFTSAQQMQAHDEEQKRKRNQERNQRAQNFDMIQAEIAVSCFNRIDGTLHKPSSSLEKAAVYLCLKRDGWLNLDEQTKKIVEEEEAKQKAAEETKRIANTKFQTEELERRARPEKLILNAWQTHQLNKIEALPLERLEKGCSWITANMRGITMRDDEIWQVINFVRNLITSKKQTVTQTPRKRRFL